MKKVLSTLVLGSALVASMVFVGTATAGPGKGGKGLKSACAADVQRLCADAGNKREKLQCLADNQDSLSEACIEKVSQVQARKQERRQKFEAACGADAQNFCGGIEPGKELKQCLRDNRDSLSSSCRELADRAGKNGKKGKKGKKMRKAIKQACSADFQNYCGELERGDKGARRACIQEHSASFSQTCQDTLAQARENRKGKRGDRNN